MDQILSLGQFGQMQRYMGVSRTCLYSEDSWTEICFLIIQVTTAAMYSDFEQREQENQTSNIFVTILSKEESGFF